MSEFAPRLTPDIQARIASFVRAGAFPQVAAEAAGVPRRTFDRWLKRGERADAEEPYRAFARAVREAEAQARLRAENTVFDKRPFDWLKCGPGKEIARRPGWSAAPRAQSATRGDGDALGRREVQLLLARMLREVQADPPLREKMADLLTKVGPPRRGERPDAGL
jgi:hypothetical protein